ncbi:MAG: thioredoxin domain-containing protein [Alphaproteobacteria bacterium]|nr:thioredoxin domain-containing protein [Alphaproteobacteria bacterium]
MKKGLLLLVSFFFCATAYASSLPADIKPTDLRVYGKENKEATIYVFSSLTCPHCSVFHSDIMPEIKKEYVESGKSKLIYVDMPSESRGLTGTMLSRCINPEKYEDFMDLMFENQQVWVYAKKPRAMLTRFATMLGGLTAEEVDICLLNQELKQTILEQQLNLSRLYNIEAMPSVVIIKNDEIKKIQGADKEAIMHELKGRLGE